jgi:hypothetical protein
MNKQISLASDRVLSVKEITNAETAILRYVQYQFFKTELKLLGKKQNN